MNERESWDAATESRQDITKHSEQSLPHEGAIGHYLAGMAYAVTHPRKTESDRAPGDTTGDDVSEDTR